MTMANRTLIALIVIALFVGVGGLLVLSRGEKSKSGSKQTEQVTPAPVSKPAPVAISQFRGTVATASATSLTVSSKDGESKTFTLTIAVDMQRLVSGTLEAGDAKTEKAQLSDLNVDQEVLIVLNKDAGDVRAVLIIK